ncbi:MAG TPA: glycosyltransferase family 4 protein [Chitinophagaceae bacterium]|nr:glycosyltransferase family 4 protein [Chitinophagaceae bacterium]
MESTTLPSKELDIEELDRRYSIKHLAKDALFNMGYLIGKRSKLKLTTKNIFFFYKYQIGGAEFVHLKILQSIPADCLIVFLGDSENNGFLADYKKCGTIWDFGKLSKTVYYLLLGRLAATINCHKERLNIFGVSMVDYYKLVEHIQPGTHNVMDIIHAFNSIPVCPKDLIAQFAQRIVIDKNTYNLIQEYYKEHGLTAYSDKVKLVYNYTDLPEVLKKETNERLKIIYVGRSTYEKRVHLIKEIARRCHAEKLNLEFVLVGPDREDVDESNSCYKSLGLVANGSALNGIYESADIILLTSSREGFPIVLMEAMGYGAIPITTAVGGIPYHIKDRCTGFLVPSTDEESIINNFVSHIRSLNEERGLLKQMSDNCRTYAKENFSKATFQSEYKKLFGIDQNNQ